MPLVLNTNLSQATSDKKRKREDDADSPPPKKSKKDIEDDLSDDDRVKIEAKIAKFIKANIPLWEKILEYGVCSWWSVRPEINRSLAVGARRIAKHVEKTRHNLHERIFEGLHAQKSKLEHWSHEHALKRIVGSNLGW